MDLLYNILIITTVIVYIIDFSGFLHNLTKKIYKMLNPNKEYNGQQLPKPFSCSTCMVFWIVLFYCLNYINLIYSFGIAVGMCLLIPLIQLLIQVYLKIINKYRIW